MKDKRARSGGVRNPVRNAVLSGLITVASIVLVLLDVADMRETGRSGSPLLTDGVRCWLQALAGETMGDIERLDGALPCRRR